jgi:predicted AlkP superfamily phosphohydrolase/phosphomutase
VGGERSERRLTGLSQTARFEGLLWVIWDGASFDVVQELLDSGQLPALGSLLKGRVLWLQPLSPSCQTPPSLATLFTGAAIVDHEVTGYRMPSWKPGTSFVESTSGFDPAAVQRPLIWDELAAKGCWLGLSHVPWTGDKDASRWPGSVAVHALDRRLDQPRFIPVSAGAAQRSGGQSLDLGGRALIVNEHDGVYEIVAPESGESVRVVPSREVRFAERALRLGPGLATKVGLLIKPDSVLLLAHTGLWEMQVQPRQRQQSLDAALGAFAGRSLGDAYHDGDLGARAMEGGAGAAEQALVASARLQVESFTRACEFILRDAPTDGLVISYLPTIDEIQHEVFRWTGYGPAGENVSRVREVLRSTYALADEQLARFLRHVGPRCKVVVASDHGAAVLRRNFHVNEALARAGLLRFDRQGGIDVRASQAAYHPAGNGSVWINTDDRAGGLVSRRMRRSVADSVERILRDARDPQTGLPPVEVKRLGEAERDKLGDLFLYSIVGYDCRSEPGPDGSEYSKTPKGGTHVTPTGESTLRGVFATNQWGQIRDYDAGMTLADVHSVVRGLVTCSR